MFSVIGCNGLGVRTVVIIQISVLTLGLLNKISFLFCTGSYQKYSLMDVNLMSLKLSISNNTYIQL